MSKRLLCLGLMSLSIVTAIKAATTASWTSAAPMAFARYGAAGGVAGGKFIVVLGNAEVFDPIQGWSTVASPPVSVAYAAGAGIGSKLYVAGGCNAGDCGLAASNSNALQIFDTSTGTWSQGAPMPTRRHLLSMAAIGGKLYAVGGYTAGFRPVTTLECYDPASNSWSTLTPMVFARASAFAGAIDGQLYVAGGFSNPGVQDKVEAYDPTTDRWTTKTPMPAGQQNGGSAVVDGRLVAIGGTGPSGSSPSANIAIYNAALDAWSAGPAVPTARYGLVAGVINGKTYAAGGANFASVVLNTVEALTVPGNPDMALDTPASGSTSGSRVLVSGWAIDRDAATGTGVDTVHVYAFLNAGSSFGPGIFLGTATLGGSRADVAAVFGSQFLASGFSLLAPALTPGAYRIAAYSRSTVTGSFAQVRFADITVTAASGSPAMTLETPPAGASVVSPWTVSGWAVDKDAAAGAGVDAVHVYAYPNTNGVLGVPIFLGAATLGVLRNDVATAFGSQFAASGFTLQAAISPGSYRVVAYARSVVTGTVNQQRFSDITIRAPGLPDMAVDTPVGGQTIAAGFPVSGWAIDRDAASGTGVDAVHVWAFRTSDGQPTFLGAAALGGARPDVAAVFGSRFTNSGYALTTLAIAAGTYDIGVYAHSSVTGTFNQQRFVRITVSSGTMSGSWYGASPDGMTVDANSVFCDTSDDVLLQLAQAGSTFTGTISLTRRGVRPGCSGPILGGSTLPVFSGVVNGSSVTFSAGQQGTQQVVNFTGTLSSNNSRLSGTLTFQNGPVGTMVVNKVVTDNPCASSPCTLSVPATYTFTVPANVTSLSVQAWGAGGGAGGGCTNTGGVPSTGGAAGGGGGYTTGTLAVTPGQTLTIVVGAGGAGGSTPANGASSTVGGMTANGGGKGGGAAANCPNSTPGGAGGTASGGTTNLTGGSGTAGAANGPGGTGGTAAGPGGGAGGTGAAAGSNNGGNGQAPGGGAGGDGGGGTQGAAAPGRVVISWQ